MFVPEPVIKMVDHAASTVPTATSSCKALKRFRKEDPTFRVTTDEETSETIIAGMGELHLEIYVERIRREYKVEVDVGAPKVSYREAPTKAAEFNYKHKKQTGGSGQYAHIVGKFEPLPRRRSRGDFVFEDKVVGGRIPKEYIPSVEKGFRDDARQGPGGRAIPIVGVKVDLEDGSYHDVDSSRHGVPDLRRNCFRETFLKTKPVLLEPIMKVEVEVPEQVPGSGRRRTHQPPRHDRGHRNATAASPTIKPKCRWPRRSATRPTCAA